MSKIWYTVGAAYNENDNFLVYDRDLRTSQEIYVQEWGSNLVVMDNFSYDSMYYVNIDGLQFVKPSAGGLKMDFSDNTVGVHILANSYGDNLRTGAGIDELNGGDGNDILEGGAGGDIINGGAGVDTVSFEHAQSGLFIDVQFGLFTDDAFGDQYSNIENWRGSGFNDTIYVDGGGVNTVEGGGGADYLGGDASDIVSYEHSSAGVQVNLGMAGAQISSGDASGDSIEGFMNASGSRFVDTLTGDSNANFLYGGDGADILASNGGNDRLIGGAGDDDMTGGFGDDRYYVDSSSDTVHEVAGQGTDTVLTSVSFTLGAGESIESLRAVGAISGVTLIGNAEKQAIVGSDFDDTIIGGGGTDSLYGGNGNDVYYVDYTGTKVIEISNQGYDAVLASVNYTLGANIEELRLYGTNAINGSGNSQTNFISGNNSSNSIYGEGGDDSLFGEGGSDRLLGGDGDDYITGGQGGDLLYGNSGADNFLFNYASESTTRASDTIRDFQSGVDHINLIWFRDENGTSVQWQSFDPSHTAFGGTAGELITKQSGTNTLLQGDINGDKVADLQIVLNGNVSLQFQDVLTSL